MFRSSLWISEPGGVIVIIQDRQFRIPRYRLFAFHETDRDPLTTPSTSLIFPPTYHLCFTISPYPTYFPTLPSRQLGSPAIPPTFHVTYSLASIFTVFLLIPPGHRS